MGDSVDIIQLDAANIIVSIRYGNQQQTTNLAIPMISIRMITVNTKEVLIYHGATVEKITLEPDMALD